MYEQSIIIIISIIKNNNNNNNNNIYTAQVFMYSIITDHYYDCQHCVMVVVANSPLDMPSTVEREV